MKKIISYIFLTLTLILGCAFAVQAAETEHKPADIPGLTFDHSMDLSYAKEFNVDYYNDGYALLTIDQEGQFLVVPEGKKAPEGLDPRTEDQRIRYKRCCTWKKYTCTEKAFKFQILVIQKLCEQDRKDQHDRHLDNKISLLLSKISIFRIYRKSTSFSRNLIFSQSFIDYPSLFSIFYRLFL